MKLKLWFANFWQLDAVTEGKNWPNAVTEGKNWPTVFYRWWLWKKGMEQLDMEELDILVIFLENQHGFDLFFWKAAVFLFCFVFLPTNIPSVKIRCNLEEKSSHCDIKSAKTLVCFDIIFFQRATFFNIKRKISVSYSLRFATPHTFSETKTGENFPVFCKAASW